MPPNYVMDSSLFDQYSVIKSVETRVHNHNHNQSETVETQFKFLMSYYSVENPKH